MKFKKILVLVVFAAISISVFVFPFNIENRTLKNVKIESNLWDACGILKNDYKIPVVIETDVAHGRVVKVSYSARKTTVKKLLDVIVPKDSFVWRVEGGILHIIEKSLDKRPDYPLNTPITRFSETGNYSALFRKALEQVRDRNFPEPVHLTTWNLEKCFIQIKAQNTTLRGVLDRIALKGGITYSVVRSQDKDGAYYFSVVLQENVVWPGLSSIPEPPPPPCVAEQSFCAGWVFSLLMFGVIVIFPYIMTVFSRFDRERILVWRKFYAILFVCYVPVIIILYRVIAFYNPEKDFGLLLLHYCLYCFVFLGMTILAKKLLDLKLAWWKFIPLAMVYYFAAVVLLFFLSDSTFFCKNDCLSIGGPR